MKIKVENYEVQQTELKVKGIEYDCVVMEMELIEDGCGCKGRDKYRWTKIKVRSVNVRTYSPQNSMATCCLKNRIELIQ